MAMGQMSKLFVFFIVINSLVAYMGGSGLLGEDVNVEQADDYVSNLKNQSGSAQTETNTTSGISILDYFNPLNYEQVSNALSLVTGFFIDPILLFGVLPSPLSYMLGTIFSVLELMAIAGFIRGFVA